MKIPFVLLILLAGCQSVKTATGELSRKLSSDVEAVTLPELQGSWCSVDIEKKQGHILTFGGYGRFSGTSYSYKTEKVLTPVRASYTLVEIKGVSFIRVMFLNNNTIIASSIDLSVVATNEADLKVFQGNNYRRCAEDHDFSESCKSLDSSASARPLTRSESGAVCAGGIWL